MIISDEYFRKEGFRNLIVKNSLLWLKERDFLLIEFLKCFLVPLLNLWLVNSRKEGLQEWQRVLDNLRVFLFLVLRKKRFNHIENTRCGQLHHDLQAASTTQS
jgi:hypothetical protein